MIFKLTDSDGFVFLCFYAFSLQFFTCTDQRHFKMSFAAMWTKATVASASCSLGGDKRKQTIIFCYLWFIYLFPGSVPSLSPLPLKMFAHWCVAEKSSACFLVCAPDTQWKSFPLFHLKGGIGPNFSFSFLHFSSHSFHIKATTSLSSVQMLQFTLERCRDLNSSGWEHCSCI